MKIIADNKIPFLKGILEPYAEVFYVPGREINKEIIKDADALLIRTRTKCTRGLLKGTDVRFIGTATIGFDHIDTQFCDKNEIFWTNAPGCNSFSVQQYITASLLKMAHKHKFNLNEKTIGIVGVGNVGSKVEMIAGILGMKILLNDPPRARKEGGKRFVELDTILSESDIVTLHVPYNVVGKDSTYHFFNKEIFERMKKGAWFLNTSRGEVTETSALKGALNTGRVGGAILDVWENEPDIDLELMSKAFLATPHIAGYSTDGKANGTAMVVNSLSKFFNFPIKDWYSENIPQPLSPVISIDGKGKSDVEIVRDAVFHTYNITEDDTEFRFSPSDFEKLRGAYQLRREFPSFSIDIKSGSDGVKKMLEGLGFKIIV